MTDNKTTQERNEMGEKIALALGWEWTPAEEQQNPHGFHIDGPEGSGLFLRFRDGRINVSGRWPEHVNQHSFYPSNHGTDVLSDITVSASRSPEQVARDINKRYIPLYFPVFQKKKQERADYIARQAMRHERANELASLCGGSPPYRHEDKEPAAHLSYSESKLYGHMKVGYGGDIHLDIHDVPFDLAKQIVRLLAAARGAK